MSTKRKIFYIIMALVLAFGAYGVQRAFAVTPGLYLVDGNPNCANLYQGTVLSGPTTSLADLGPLFGLKYDANPTTSMTHTFTTGGKWVVTNGPQDPNNTVSIFNVILNGGSGVQFDWSSTLGLDAVIVKAQDANAYVYSPEVFGSTGLTAPLGKAISHIEFCYDYELTVTKTADTSFTRTYQWKLEKGADATYDKFIGAPDWTHSYDILLTQTGYVDSGWKVTGNIIIENKTPFAATITAITDVVSGVAGNAVITCPPGVTFPYTLPIGQTLVCTYSKDLPDGTNRTNTATVTTSGTVGGGSDDELVDFGKAVITEVNKTVHLSDDYGTPSDLTDDLPFGPYSASALAEYDRTYSCPTDKSLYAGDGVYSYTVINTAKIVELPEKNDDATVVVNCYAPVVWKDAEASYNEKHYWEIDKNVDPLSQDKFVGEDAAFQWKVVVTETVKDEDMLVTGAIKVKNPAPMPMTVTLTDVLSDATSATIKCTVGTLTGDQLTIPANTEALCTYEAKPADILAAKNTVTASLNKVDFSYEAKFTWDKTVIDGSVWVDDDQKPGWPAEISDGDTFYINDKYTCSSDPADYFKDPAKPGQYTYTENNLAKVYNDTHTLDQDDASTTVKCYAPVVWKDAKATYNEKHYWEIDKTVDPLSQAKFVGEEAAFQWKVVVTETVKDEDFLVTGAIKVKNPAPMAMTVTLTDVLSDATSATIKCSVGILTGDQLTIPANTEALCTYEAKPAGMTADENTATATLNKVDFSYAAKFTWDKTVIDGSVWVDDDQKPGWPAEISDGDTFYINDKYTCSSDPADYFKDPAKPGQYTYTENNLAKVYNDTHTLDQDDASTTVKCYAPVVWKDAAGKYTEEHGWTVDKKVTPASQSGYPGDKLSWTWEVTVTEKVTFKDFKVSGKIYVKNPAPDAMTVTLIDKLGDGTVATITACSGDANLADGLTIAGGATAECDYTATATSEKVTKNIATVTLNKVDFVGEKVFSWTPVPIIPTVKLTDDQKPLNETLTGHTAAGTYTFGPYSYGASHTCSTNKGDYFDGDTYKAITATLVNVARVWDSSTELDNDDATTTWTCEAGFMDLLKLTQGMVDPTQKWSFALYEGPDGFEKTQIGTGTTFEDADGLLDFGAPALRPDKTYTVCELGMPAGWTSIWTLNGSTINPYNPNADDSPAQDLGNRCVDFGKGTEIPVVVGTTLHFKVDNTYPGGEPRTPGYWKNWNACTGGGQYETAMANGGGAAGYWTLDELLNNPGFFIGDMYVNGIWNDDIYKFDSFNHNDCIEAVRILNKSDAKTGKKMANDAAYELATALFAAKLNLAAGAESCPAVQDAVLKGQALLEAIKFNGAGDYLGPKVKGSLVSLRQQALSLAYTLDQYNNGYLCP